MSKKEHQYILVLTVVLLINFMLSTLAFFMAYRQGNEGVTLQLFGGGDDGQFYWEQALNVANAQPWIRTSIYPLIIGNLMKITGIQDVYLIRMFNYVGYVILVLFSVKIGELLIQFESEKQLEKYYINAKVVILIGFLFYTSLQLNLHVSILRDIWIYALYVWAAYLFLKIMHANINKWIYILALIPILWLLGQFRPYILVSFLLATVIHTFYNYIGQSKHISKLVIVLIMMGVVYYTFFIDFTLPIVNMSLRDALNYRMSSLTEFSGGSQMWINLNQPNVIFFLFNYIHSFFGNLIGPLPGDISGFSTLIVFFVETIPMVLMLIFIFRNRQYLSKAQNFLLLHAFTWSALIAVSNDNVGTGTRLRPVTWILILIVVSVLYYKVRVAKKIKQKEGIIYANSVYEQ